jgi:hypothetical protein
MSMMAVAIQLLIEAGVTGDGLVSAVARLDAAQDNRSAGARRQARYRARLKGRDEQPGSPDAAPVPRDDGDARDGGDASGGSSPNDIYSNPLLPQSSEEDDPPSPESGTASIAERAVAAWNAAAAGAGLARARRLDRSRRGTLASLAKAHGEQAVLDAIANLAASRFHCGENDRGWKATLGRMLDSQRNFLKALDLGEGAASTQPAMSEAARSAHLEQLDAKPWATRAAPPPPDDRRGRAALPIGALAGRIAAQVAA